MSSPSTRVVIAGGGLAGLGLACLLARAGLECTVLENNAKSEGADDDPRALAITHATRSILEACGAWSQIPPEKTGYFRGMHVWDENGRGEVSFDSAELCQPTLGYIVQQSRVQHALESVVSVLPGVDMRYGSSIENIQWLDEGIEVSVSDGERISASLLVAADGVNSRCRELAGIQYPTRDYQQRAVACLVRTALGHDDIARQRFLCNGPLAFLPMHEANQCGVVWSTTPEHANDLLQMDEQQFNNELQEAFELRLGQVEQSEQRKRFPLLRAQAEHYCLESLALIGDAAHSVHPLAGQGANLGFLDAASLAQLVLEAHRKNRNIAGRRVLRAYERWRKVENRTMMMIFEGFKYTFENQAAPIPMLRNQALDIANSIVPLKHTIMRHAMGLAGDLPEFAKANIA